MSTRKNCQTCTVQKQIRTISFSKKEITDEKEINTGLFKFYKGLFEPKVNISNVLIQDYLSRIEILKLSEEQLQRCEGVITEEELLKVLMKKKPNSKEILNRRNTTCNICH